MIELRPYQEAAVASVYTYFSVNDGNPVIVLPTGAGKSLVLAAFIRRAIEQYPQTNVLVLTHVKELIEQDMRAIVRYWPEAPIAVWSASLKSKRKSQVTVAGIQSIHRHPGLFHNTDLVIIDEAHLVSKKADTMYGKFLSGLRKYNPHLKIIGLTATHYRMDSGILTEGEGRIFTDVCYEAEVGDLIKQGYLCPLISKGGVTRADLSGVQTRGGEYVEQQLQEAMDREELIRGALEEVERLAQGRQHILAFCTGIEHAKHCAEAAQARGWAADYVTGEMDGPDRDQRINDFKSGRIRLLCNANLLTTGFDAPHIDCIVMLRPTKSTGLYVQIMGRGLRRHECKDDTLVLDFSGNIERHGPIDQIKVKKKREGSGEGVSVAPAKQCPECQAIILAALAECPECGYLWPTKPSHGTQAADAVVVAALSEPARKEVSGVHYAMHQKPGRPPSLRVDYLCGLSTFTEWVPIEDDRSYVRKHAVRWFWERGQMCPETVEQALALLQTGRVPAPDAILVKPDGKYWRVDRAIMGSRRLNVSTVERPGVEVSFADDVPF